VPVGYSVYEGFDLDGYSGDVRAPWGGTLGIYNLGLKITLPPNTYPAGILEALSLAGVRNPTLKGISRIQIDLGHVKENKTGWADKGAAIAEIQPYNANRGQTKVALKVNVLYAQTEYVFSPTLFNLDVPWECFPDSPYDCVPETRDYAP